MEDRTEIIETTPSATRRRTACRARAPKSEPSSTASARSTASKPWPTTRTPNKRMAAYRVMQLVYWVFGLIEGLIAIRFVLKALGANPAAGFAEFIYGITGAAGRAVLRAVRQPGGAGQRARSAFASSR